MRQAARDVGIVTDVTIGIDRLWKGEPEKLPEPGCLHLFTGPGRGGCLASSGVGMGVIDTSYSRVADYLGSQRHLRRLAVDVFPQPLEQTPLCSPDRRKRNPVPVRFVAAQHIVRAPHLIEEYAVHTKVDCDVTQCLEMLEPFFAGGTGPDKLSVSELPQQCALAAETVFLDIRVRVVVPGAYPLADSIVVFATDLDQVPVKIEHHPAPIRLHPPDLLDQFVPATLGVVKWVMGISGIVPIRMPPEE